jgi:hypothetical protein
MRSQDLWLYILVPNTRNVEVNLTWALKQTDIYVADIVLKRGTNLRGG